MSWLRTVFADNARRATAVALALAAAAAAVIPREQLLAAWQLVLEHQWVPFIAVAVGLVVRVLKSDVTWAPNMPFGPNAARWRPLVALGLGVVGGVVQAIQAGTPLGRALLEGLIAAMVAMASHDVVIAGVRNGKELFSPAAPKAPAVPAPAALLPADPPQP